MTTFDKNFVVKNGIVVNSTVATVNGNQVLTEASSINALNDVTITSATTGQVLKYNGSAWINDTDATGGGGGLTVSDTAPVSPSEGDLWYKSDTGRTYVRYDSYWVEIDTSQKGDSADLPFTTKGDLLTRTSSDVAALAVGTVDGYSLTVNSSETTGLLWAPIGVSYVPHVSGSTYKSPAVAAGEGTNTAVTEDVTYYCPFFVPTKTTYNQISIRTGSGHSGTSTVRLGIYQGRTGVPTTLILDGGTVSATGTSAVITLTINQTLDAGWYFIAANVQTPGATPNFYSVSNTGSNVGALVGMPGGLSGSIQMGFSETGVTGAFADAGTVTRSFAILCGMRVA